MQFVISDRVPNCFLESLGRQHFFIYKINSEWMRTNFGTNKFPITSGRFANAYPELAAKYGMD